MSYLCAYKCISDPPNDQRTTIHNESVITAWNENEDSRLLGESLKRDIRGYHSGDRNLVSDTISFECTASIFRVGE